MGLTRCYETAFLHFILIGSPFNIIQCAGHPDTKVCPVSTYILPAVFFRFHLEEVPGYGRANCRRTISIERLKIVKLSYYWVLIGSYICCVNFTTTDSGVAGILLRGGGHGRVAHGFRSLWWQSHPEVKPIMALGLQKRIWLKFFCNSLPK